MIKTQEANMVRGWLLTKPEGDRLGAATEALAEAIEILRDIPRRAPADDQTQERISTLLVKLGFE